MLQELFRIPGLGWPVYGYGLMLVLGVWTAVELGRYLFNRLGFDGEAFVFIGLLALASGVFGARLSHVLENLSYYTSGERTAWENLRAALDLSNGGLTFYGGFLVSTPVLIGYALWRGIPIRPGMDVVAACLMVGLAFGRVGCLLNGCCWGQTCDPDRVPWAVTFPYGSPPYQGQFEAGQLTVGAGDRDVPPALVRRVRLEDGGVADVLLTKEQVEEADLGAVAASTRSLPVHPTQVYSTVNALLIAGACVAFLGLRPRAGRVFALMLLMYGPGRFVLETVRIEPAVEWGLSYSQWVSIGVTAAGAVLWFVFGRLGGGDRAPTTVVNPG